LSDKFFFFFNKETTEAPGSKALLFGFFITKVSRSVPGSDSWSLSHLGYLYPGTTPVMIKLDHDRSCPWVSIAQVTETPTITTKVSPQKKK